MSAKRRRMSAVSPFFRELNSPFILKMLAGAPAYVYNGHTIAINRDNRYGVYMKKRIALLLVLIIALSVCIGALVGCDAIITRNAKDFESSLVRAMTAQEFFNWLRDEKGVDYQEVVF